MPRKSNKSTNQKKKEQKIRMKERRSHVKAKSNTSINCPVESNTSINCPVESNTSINCPEESNISINCPKESNISINCPVESNTSINCPEESNTSINCPVESNTSINCPEESNISIKCPVESNTSKNCSEEESNTSINCPKKSNNSKNCLEESNTSLKCPKFIEKQKSIQKTNKSIETTEKCKLNRKRSSGKMMCNSNKMPSSLKQRKVDKNEMRNLVVQGSFHQGDTRFGFNSGKQCVANSLSAIAHTKLKNVDEWDQAFLDNVLIKGNEIYTWIHGSNDLLLMSDLPEMIELSGKVLNIRKKDSITATTNSDESVDFSAFGNCLPLDLAIQESLIDADGCFICAVDKTFMVMKHDQDMYIFDSHSRNGFGLIDPNGKSLLMQLRDIDHLYEYCCNMVHGVVPESQWFEITGVNVNVHECSEYQPRYHISTSNTHVRNDENRLFESLSIDMKMSESTKDTKLDKDCNQCPKTQVLSENTNAIVEDYSEIEIVSENFGNVKYDFIPLTIKSKKQLCSALKICSKNVSKRQSAVISNMGHPKTTKQIASDGNCLFRAISYAISNRQEYYQKVRHAVVNHMRKNQEAFQSFLRYEYNSIEEYIKITNIEKDTVWGTELEILAAADLLKTDIFTFLNGSWVKYSSSQISNSNVVKNESIYLQHFGGINHYECVTSVNTVNKYGDENSSSGRQIFSDNETEVEPQISRSEKENMKYKECEKFRNRKRKMTRERYSTVTEYKETKKRNATNCYENDIEYKEKIKSTCRNKYSSNEQFRKDLKNARKKKYECDEHFRAERKNASKNRYSNDESFRQKLITENKEKYANDQSYRENLKTKSKEKYETNEPHRNQKKDQVSLQRKKHMENCQNIENVINDFKDEVQKGPEYVCACCFRLLFEKQVVSCVKDKYDPIVGETCISEKYLHKCDEKCTSDCSYIGTNKTTLWICYTCHRKLLKGIVPADSFTNNLELEDVPKELGRLNSLEHHLVALNIPFMKILGLPKGGQKGVHGPVVCVPSDLKKVTTTLPRSEDESLLLKVKLKRKLKYKGYEEYQFVNSKHLEEALSFLKENNEWYSHVELNKDWFNPIPDENQSNTETKNTNASETDEMETNENLLQENTEIRNVNNTENETESDSFLTENLQGVQLDTCLQPADIGQNVLDLCFDQVFEISPAEDNTPISVLQENGIEAKTFPAHFPTGKHTMSEERNEKLTMGRYFNLRLMSVDNRFAQDTSYIFFSQYLTELNRVISNVQISLRKGPEQTFDGKPVTAEMLCDKNVLKELFKKDEAIKFLKPVRGTPPYWQAAQKDIFAMIRQLGIPQFFCSFSSADFRWPEIVQTIMTQQGDTRDFEELTWNDKCKILRSNPVTVARMFDNRFHTFLQKVILSNSEPIGKVIDYFYRVEFQQRGSPHTHCLFWIENAPKFRENPETDVVEFIDKYITCEIPDKHEDQELHDIVMAVQQHSKNHSKSCKKKGTVCRFNFPRPPSEKTFISKPQEDVEKEKEHLAKERLSQLWDAIKDNSETNLSSSEILHKAGLSQEEFEECFRYVTKRDTVVLQRQTSEVFTNQYNKHLLKAWNANMDIQYILDAFSCVVYIISYISKAERELGLLLQQTKNEAIEGNCNAQEAMRKVGTAYLHHREISAQEAVFRVTGLRLRECSRKIEFVPVGENPCRMSIPLKEVQKKHNTSKLNIQHSTAESNCLDDNSEIWMKNMIDRYKGRPDNTVFQEMCLARFCADFSVVVESQLPKKINEETTFKLENNLGWIRKRTMTKPAVIRYPRFSIETAKEKYYQSILQLFLPYREDWQLKPAKFETYEDFYENGFVNLSSEKKSLLCVKELVNSNLCEFVKTGQMLEEAEKMFETQGPQEDAWCELCPETEVNRMECVEEGTHATVEGDESLEQPIPDLNRKDKPEQTGTNLLFTSFTKNEIVPLLRTLNSTQKEIFYQVRDWCLRKKNGQNPKPFHVFVTGGAGTGKSHLIKCIYYEANRLLATLSDNPDDLSVLLTAPTGAAAFNINGLTIHSALGIFKTLSADHAILSEDKINSLRSKLENLQILVIDEISMVNKRLLFFVHERMRQIKKMPESCAFGGVSIIAVGDFYQLPPVKTRRQDKLFVDDPSSPMNILWNDLFQIVELKEIMRQREDRSFAELLNRLRVKKGTEQLVPSDRDILRRCIREGPPDALHVFATNEEIKSYNNDMIMNACTEPILIEAEDYEKEKASGKLKRKTTHFTKSDICLPSSLLLAEGARVMLIKNEDVHDGLVNGVMGTVMKIDMRSGRSLPDIVFIHFDHENVGRGAKIQKTINEKRCVGIRPSNEDISFRNGVRKQFPLQLAWACTIHKVQGLTVKECVVGLNKCFASGQAYVALSRVTSVSGLYINEIDQDKLCKKIKCDPDIENGISKMKKYLPVHEGLDSSQKCFKILYHNIQGFQNHFEDLKSTEQFKKADCVCLTETWLNQTSCIPDLEGFTSSHITRYSAFDASCSLFEEIKNMEHGGVSAFFKKEVKYEEMKHIAKNLESIVFKIDELDIIIATIYRPQRYSIGAFMNNFSLLIDKLELLSTRLIVLGDFNQDIINNQSSVLNFMSAKGFSQYVENPTTENGTLIDHVYVKGFTDIEVSTVPTYFSYHEAIALQLEI